MTMIDPPVTWRGEAVRRRATADNAIAQPIGGNDLALAAAVAALLVLGVDMVYSASYVMAEDSPQYASATYLLRLYSAHADSIYAVIGEELGLLGAALVLALFLLIAYRGFRIALAAPDAFGSLLASGVTARLVLQVLTNMAVATSSVPFTGIFPPFVSYGGSPLVTCVTGVGLLLGVSCQTVRAADSPTRDGAGPPVTAGRGRAL